MVLFTVTRVFHITDFIRQSEVGTNRHGYWIGLIKIEEAHVWVNGIPVNLKELSGVMSRDSIEPS